MSKTYLFSTDKWIIIINSKFWDKEWMEIRISDVQKLNKYCLIKQNYDS